jgi:cytochrome c oxidase subunit 2
MEGNLRVVSQEEYETWMAAREEEALAAAQTPEGRGKTLSTQNGCLGCHTVDGAAGTGPTWFNLYGKQEGLADGTTVTVDDAYIHESIVDPQAKLVAGFESVIMPKFELTDEQIADIIAYIKTLK